MNRLRSANVMLAVVVLLGGLGCSATGEGGDSPRVDDSAEPLVQGTSQPKPIVVLVHGAFAGSEGPPRPAATLRTWRR